MAENDVCVGRQRRGGWPQRPWLLATALIACTSASRPASALLLGGYRSLGEIASAHNLLVVKVPPGSKPIFRTGDTTCTTHREVEVIAVLRGPRMDELREVWSMGRDLGRGDGEAQRVIVSTLGSLEPGKRYLLAGERASIGGKRWLLFHFIGGVAEIPNDFRLTTLKDKSIKQQVAAILVARQAAAAREMEALRVEKEFLDMILRRDAAQGAPDEETDP